MLDKLSGRGEYKTFTRRGARKLEKLDALRILLGGSAGEKKGGQKVDTFEPFSAKYGKFRFYSKKSKYAKETITSENYCLKNTAAKAKEEAAAKAAEAEREKNNPYYGKHYSVGRADEVLSRRKDMNSKISDLLKQNGISLDDSDDFKIDVSFDHTITVTGNNEQKARTIADIFNSNGFAQDMVSHIATSNMNGTLEIASSDEWNKFYMSGRLKTYADCDWGDLTFDEKGGVFVGGERLYDVIGKHFFKGETDDEIRIIKNAIVDNALKLQRQGYDNVKNLSLSINLTKDGLMDTEVKFGFGKGQTGWYDKLMSFGSETDKLASYCMETGLI